MVLVFSARLILVDPFDRTESVLHNLRVDLQQAVKGSKDALSRSLKALEYVA